MPTSNKAMGNMLRKERDGLSSYMYGGADAETPPESAAETTSGAGLEDLLGGAELPDDIPTESFTVLAAGDTPDPEQYTYELSTEAPGAWMIYPPGVPCPSGAAKIQRSSPASAAELAEMETALLEAEGGTAESAEAEMGIEEY